MQPQTLSEENKIYNLYYFIFQSATKKLCEHFISNQEITKQVNNWVNYAIKNFNNHQDIIINYGDFFKKFPAIFKITPNIIIIYISVIIDKIKIDKRFGGWNQDELPDIEDTLLLLNVVSAREIFEMIEKGIFSMTQELAEKYDNEIIEN